MLFHGVYTAARLTCEAAEEYLLKLEELVQLEAWHPSLDSMLWPDEG